MDQNRESKLKLYSLGIVVKDKQRTSDDIQVYPIEILPFVEGKVSEAKQTFKSELPDASGKTKSITIDVDNIITATWRQFGETNRTTSPDVVANESVRIYRFTNDPKYYWTTIKNEPKIRRLEHVRWSFGNLKKPLVEWNGESSYWMQFSTMDKHIWFKTTKSDGEKYAYDFKIDSAGHYALLTDDVGNYLRINSKDTVNTLENADGSKMVQDKEDILIHANKTITETTADYTVRADKTILEQAGTTVDIKAGTVATVQAGTEIKLSAPKVSMSGSGGISMTSSSSAQIAAPAVKMEGVVSLSGGGGTPVPDIQLEIEKIWARIGGRY